MYSAEFGIAHRELNALFFSGSNSGLRQLGYSERQEQFVLGAVDLLKTFRERDVVHNPHVIYPPEPIGRLIQHVRFTQIAEGVVNFQAYRDIVREVAPSIPNLFSEDRKRVIEEHDLGELVSIFPATDRFSQPIVDLCIFLDPHEEQLKDQQYLWRITHAGSHIVFARRPSIKYDPRPEVMRRIDHRVLYSLELTEDGFKAKLSEPTKDEIEEGEEEWKFEEQWRILHPRTSRRRTSSIVVLGRVANHNLE